MYARFFGLVVVLLVASAAAGCWSGDGFPTGRFVHATNPAWAVEYNDDGTWAYYFGDMTTPEVEGTYSVEGDLYTEETVNDPTCPFPATYRWHYEADELTFELVGEDDCSARRDALEGQTYLKSP